MEFAADPRFLLWGTVYVALKWTIGLWTFRHLRAWAKARRQLGAVATR